MARKRKADVTSAAQKLGSLGGKARNKALSPEVRQDIARKAAQARWGRRKPAK